MKKLLLITAMMLVPFTAMAEPETLEEALERIEQLEAEVDTWKSNAVEASNRANVNAENVAAWYNEAMRLEDLVDDLVTERNALSIERNSALANLEAYQAYVAERYEEILQQIESLNTQIADLEAQLEEALSFDRITIDIPGQIEEHIDNVEELRHAFFGLSYLLTSCREHNLDLGRQLDEQFTPFTIEWQGFTVSIRTFDRLMEDTQFIADYADSMITNLEARIEELEAQLEAQE